MTMARIWNATTNPTIRQTREAVFVGAIGANADSSDLSSSTPSGVDHEASLPRKTRATAGGIV